MVLCDAEPESALSLVLMGKKNSAAKRRNRSYATELASANVEHLKRVTHNKQGPLENMALLEVVGQGQLEKEMSELYES